MSTRGKTSSDSSLDRAELMFLLTIRVQRFGRRIRARFAERVRSNSQTEARWSALYHLVEEEGGLIQTELADRMGIQGPTLVRLLDALESQGLVSRNEAPTDRRAKIVTLTSAGRVTVNEIDQIAAEMRNEVFAGIPDEDIRTTLSVIERLIDATAPPTARTGAT